MKEGTEEFKHRKRKKTAILVRKACDCDAVDKKHVDTC